MESSELTKLINDIPLEHANIRLRGQSKEGDSEKELYKKQLDALDAAEMALLYTNLGLIRECDSSSLALIKFALKEKWKSIGNESEVNDLKFAKLGEKMHSEGRFDSSGCEVELKDLYEQQHLLDGQRKILRELFAAVNARAEELK